MNEKSASQSPRALLQAIDQKLDLFPRWLTALWDRALPVMQVLFWCRFSIGVVLIAAGFLLLAPQGQEIAIRIGDSLPQTIIVAVGAFVWAFHSWFGARRVLRRRYGPSRGIARGESFKRLVDHMPRWIGQAAFAIATGSAIMAWAQSGWRWDTWHWLMVALNGVLGLSFFQLMKSRKAW
ncbi:MAG: hypothetical protein FJ189_11380, partial [Gammaproteobacteria bacterium]|nr:hypothetical protein [Gammaproteobacteria bacterium]